ncbi:MAG: hypothetical protein IPG38_05370 [Chitinophagaceae bacterium]|nr:hypothetical protein [Chitinophagaceae bacterium]
MVKHLRLNTTGLSNVCYAIQKDNAGFFWVSTNMWIYKINPQKDYAVQHYNTGNGLFLEYNTSCTLKENDGNFCLAVPVASPVSTLLTWKKMSSARYQ